MTHTHPSIFDTVRVCGGCLKFGKWKRLDVCRQCAFERTLRVKHPCRLCPEMCQAAKTYCWRCTRAGLAISVSAPLPSAVHSSEGNAKATLSPSPQGCPEKDRAASETGDDAKKPPAPLALTAK